MNNENKRRICIVVQSRANYARIKSTLQAIKEHPNLELIILLGASAVIERYSDIRPIMQQDGFKAHAVIHSLIEGGSLTAMAKSTGLGIIELSTQFEILKPDVVLTVADRFETLSTAVAASYMNIPVAHTQGGEVTGSIDESVRHAITKLSHIHFPATERAKEFILKMGEEPERVFFTGCPAMDLLKDLDLKIDDNFNERNLGVGPLIDYTKPYITIVQHPVTTEFGQSSKDVNEIINAVADQKTQVVWLWPNIDAGTDDISKSLRQFREKNHSAKFHFYKNLTPEDYARLIYNSSCLVGNSSSGIREAAYLGIPSVNIGNRQSGREHSINVIHSPAERKAIKNAISRQISNGKYTRSNMFGDGTAGKKIAHHLATTELIIKKKLSYLDND